MYFIWNLIKIALQADKISYVLNYKMGFFFGFFNAIILPTRIFFAINLLLSHVHWDWKKEGQV